MHQSQQQEELPEDGDRDKVGLLRLSIDSPIDDNAVIKESGKTFTKLFCKDREGTVELPNVVLMLRR